MMASSSATSMWMKFFSEAGIPENVAANYSITFAEHRIAMSMLLDLNKEILHDMGVTVMGDVIAVLKHAKFVHERVAREKVLKTSSPVVTIAPVVTSFQRPVEPRTIPRVNPTPVNPGRIVLKRKVQPPSSSIAKPRLVVSKKPRAEPVKQSVFNRLDKKLVATTAAPKAETSVNSVFDRLGPGEKESSSVKANTVAEAKKLFPTLARKVAQTSKVSHGILAGERMMVSTSVGEARGVLQRRKVLAVGVFGRLGPQTDQ